MLTADCERWTSSAARLMLPVSATATIIERTSRSSTFMGERPFGIRKPERFYQNYAFFFCFGAAHSRIKGANHERANRSFRPHRCTRLARTVVRHDGNRRLDAVCRVRRGRTARVRAWIAMRLPLLERA